jgi:hypothetical protein
MPKTYHNAIITTRNLGIRYLWIDAICIVQNDTDDWQKESSKMSHVYQHSHCTIAITAGTHADDGFLHPRPAERYPLPQDPQIFDKAIKPALPTENVLVGTAPLNKRAWILQEMYLSPRILYFTPHCLYFQCFDASFLRPMCISFTRQRICQHCIGDSCPLAKNLHGNKHMVLGKQSYLITQAGA